MALGRQDGDAADPACAADMGAAAGRQVEIADLDQSEHAGARRIFSERKRDGLLPCHEANGDRPVLPDDLVRDVNGPLNVCGRHVACHVDSGVLRSHMEADRGVLEESIQCRRQQMLAGMLLHVVESAGPVHLTGYGSAARERRCQDMNDRILIDNVDHFCTTELAVVEGLTARCRIEGRAVERNRRPAVVLEAARHSGAEGTAVGIGVVNAVCHRRPEVTAAFITPVGCRGTTGAPGGP